MGQIYIDANRNEFFVVKVVGINYPTGEKQLFQTDKKDTPEWKRALLDQGYVLTS